MVDVPVRGFVGAVGVGDRLSRVGKSTVCGLLKSRGELAVDADWEGCNHWVDRTNRQVVADRHVRYRPAGSSTSPGGVGAH
jgi:hypothetical protein